MVGELKLKHRGSVADWSQLLDDTAGIPSLVGMGYEGGAGGPGDEDLAMAEAEQWEASRGIDPVLHFEDIAGTKVVTAGLEG